MTVKAFAEKYGIPYWFASKVSGRTKTVPTIERDHDYLEEDLKNSLVEIYREKIDDALNTANFYGIAITEAENIFTGHRKDKLNGRI